MKKPFHLLFFPLIALPSCVEFDSRDNAAIPIIEVKSEELPFPQLALKNHDHDKSITLNFQNITDEIRRHNPQLAAARQLIAEAHGRLAQSGLKANPELEAEFQTDRHFDELMLTVGVAQRFPRTQRLVLEKKVSATLVQAAQAEVRDVERKLIGEARAGLIEILALRQEEELLFAQQKNAEKLAEFIKNAAVRGEGSFLESATARIEATRLGNRAKQLEIKLKLATAKLKPLFDMSPESQISAPGLLPPAQLPPMQVASSQRPDLQAARLRAQSAAEATSLEQAKKYDDIEAGVFAGIGRSEDAPDGLENEQIVGIRVKIPFPSNNTNTGAVAEAAARHRRLSLEANAMNRSISAEIHAYYQEMQQWLALAQEIKTALLPLADKQITDTQAAYEKGEIPLQDVLRAQEQKLSLETAQLEALRDFHLAHNHYQTATAR